jgi:hypothetical protein
MQSTQGWDWVQASPDRNTGLWDAVELRATSSVSVRDAYVRIARVGNATAPSARPGSARAAYLARRAAGNRRCAPADVRAGWRGVDPGDPDAPGPSASGPGADGRSAPAPMPVGDDIVVDAETVVSATVSNAAAEPAAGTLTFAVFGPGAGASGARPASGPTPPTAELTGAMAVVVPAGVDALVVAFPPARLRGARLWWPHTHGASPLYEVRVAFRRAEEANAEEHEEAEMAAASRPAASKPAASSAAAGRTIRDAAHTIWDVPGAARARFGVRTTRSATDPVTGGIAFFVNGQRIFFQGGNWITTDQLLRFAGPAHAQRYRAEVRMHRDAGLNLIRVWGGGIAERDAFYDAADELGVMVMQEFWMTGDNNGRWAGSYAWPLNAGVYLANARDTVLRLRGRASLLFWCGGNELYPIEESPPPRIEAGLRAFVRLLDGSRPYVASSMTASQGFDPALALAPKDGPYGILEEAQFFLRNPGMTESVVVSFQPELGSVSHPEHASLQRFLSPSEVAAFPRCGATDAPQQSEWTYHKYISFTDGGGADHVCAYSPPPQGSAPADAHEYSMQAQMAQHRQYKALFEGFQFRAWEWYSGVLFWKSQGPWPALRGAWYDWYLAQNGGFWGARAAAKEQVHVQLDLRQRTVDVVNKLAVDVAAPRKGPSAWSVRARAFTLAGERVATAHVPMPSAAGLAAGSVAHLAGVLPWVEPAVGAAAGGGG